MDEFQVCPAAAARVWDSPLGGRRNTQGGEDSNNRGSSDTDVTSAILRKHLQSIPGWFWYLVLSRRAEVCRLGSTLQRFG